MNGPPVGKSPGGREGQARVLIFATNDLLNETRAKKEARTLQAAGHEVVLVGLGRAGLPVEEVSGGIRLVRVGSTRATSWSRPWDKLAAVRGRANAVGGIIAGFEPDVVHAVNVDGLAAAMPSARVIGAHVVYDAFEIFSEMLKGVGRPRVSWTYWSRVERKLAPQADLALTVSVPLAQELEGRTGVHFEVVLNVPPLVPMMSSGRLRDELGVSPHSPVVLYQGGLIPGRGLANLIAGLAYVPEAILAVQGDGSELAAMREASKRGGVADRVRFMGHKPESDLHEYACGADVGIVIYEATDLNNYNASPNKLFAYMMAGLPIACSDFPGLTSIVEEQGLGTSFDPSDPESIGTAIRYLLRDDARVEMGRRARRLAEDRYNWELEGRRLATLYESLLSGRVSRDRRP